MPVPSPDQVSEPPSELDPSMAISNPTLSVLLHSSSEAQSRRGLSHLLSPSSSAQCCLPIFSASLPSISSPLRTLCTRKSLTCAKSTARNLFLCLLFCCPTSLLLLHSLIALDRHGSEQTLPTAAAYLRPRKSSRSKPDISARRVQEEVSSLGTRRSATTTSALAS